MLKKRSNARNTFLRQLEEELCLPIIQDRSQNVQVMINFSMKTGIECVLQKPVNIIDEAALASASTRDQTGRKKVLHI